MSKKKIKNINSIKSLSILMAFIMMVLFNLPLISYAQSTDQVVKDFMEVSGKEPIDTSFSSLDIIKLLVVKELNTLRKSYDLSDFKVNDILSQAAFAQSENMAYSGKVYLEDYGRGNGTIDRVKYFGGGEDAKEIVTRVKYADNGKTISYQSFVNNIMMKITYIKKNLDMVLFRDYFFIGIGISLDDFGETAYISIVLGSHNTFNNGDEHRFELKYPFTTYTYGLEEEGDNVCKKCYQFKDLYELQKGLYVRDNKIYLKYDNLRAIKRLISSPTDGFAVDLVQRAQFPCKPYNILNSNKISDGILVKPRYTKKLYKKNDELAARKNKLDTYLGKMPRNFTKPYELNLIVIKDKTVCESVKRKYEFAKTTQSTTSIDIIPFELDSNLLKDYNPIKNPQLSFKIFFERGKSTFTTKDISPLVNSLNQPDFIIDTIRVFAHSSIEGSDRINEMLQKKRAQSIINVLEVLQDKEISNQNIITNDGWDLFKNEVNNTNYKYLTYLSKDEAKGEINNRDLYDKLEPIFQKQRFAKVVLDISYKGDGNTAEEKLIRKFNEAITKKEIDQALKIQTFIYNNFETEGFSYQVLKNMTIPEKAEYSNLLMNAIIFKKKLYNEKLSPDYYQDIRKLNWIDPDNKIILYNKILCSVLFDQLDNEDKVKDLQISVDQLHGDIISEELVDKLDLELQFKIMEEFYVEDQINPLITDCFNRIKRIINIGASNWEEALEKSEIFLNRKEFSLSAKILEPHIMKDDVNEELLFKYILASSNSPGQMASDIFVDALEKARRKNIDRYLQLFGAPYMSFQVLENPEIKKNYCKACDLPLDNLFADEIFNNKVSSDRIILDNKDNFVNDTISHDYVGYISTPEEKSENYSQNSMSKHSEVNDNTQVKKNLPVDKNLFNSTSSNTVANQVKKSTEIKLVKDLNGIYEVPVLLNGVLYINFIFDTGASEVQIAPYVVLTLLKAGTIKDTDWLEGDFYKFADGTTAKSMRFKLQSIKIGDKEYNDINCVIANSLKAPMLLGQSMLEKIGKFSFDYKNELLIIE